MDVIDSDASKKAAALRILETPNITLVSLYFHIGVHAYELHGLRVRHLALSRTLIRVTHVKTSQAASIGLCELVVSRWPTGTEKISQIHKPSEELRPFRRNPAETRGQPNQWIPRGIAHATSKVAFRIRDGRESARSTKPRPDSQSSAPCGWLSKSTQYPVTASKFTYREEHLSRNSMESEQKSHKWIRLATRHGICCIHVCSLVIEWIWLNFVLPVAVSIETCRE